MTDTRQLTHDELFLPDPEPREVKYTIISVDDHVVEPPHMFDGRFPDRLQALAPRIVETPEGHQMWSFDGELYTQVGMNALAGRRKENVTWVPFRFDQMRPGCYDVHARVKDMDINGIWASLNFPSMITGFCGRVYATASDPDVGMACVRAWNDWLFEEWYSEYPDRIIPGGITFLADPERGAEEIRRNAARGFTSVSMPERPHKIGFPSLFSGYWDPIIEACVETDTVINVHVGSSGMPDFPEDAPMYQVGATLFGQMSLHACVEWLWSGYAMRYPKLKIAMSEGGIGWVAMIIDRVDNLLDRSGFTMEAYKANRPSDVLRNNFWFCTLDDPSTMATRHTIGVDRIMVEVDYPHSDGTWPDTQAVVEKYWGHFPAHELRKMCSENAARLYRHPLPATVLPTSAS